MYPCVLQPDVSAVFSCQRCIEKEFLQKRQFYCKLCGSAVKRNTLTDKSVLEIEVERDFKIRRRIKEM